jgi:hypothetical protein
MSKRMSGYFRIVIQYMILQMSPTCLIMPIPWDSDILSTKLNQGTQE